MHYVITHTTVANMICEQSSSGLGLEVALQLAKHGAKVYLGCRSETRAKDAISKMRKSSPGFDLEGKLLWLPLDLSVMRLAKKAGEELLSKETRLDILSQRSSHHLAK